MAEHDDVSRTVEHALASYMLNEEPVGLDQRILRRVETDIRSRQQRRGRLWALGLAFASACFVVTISIATQSHPSPMPELSLAKVTPPSAPNLPNHLNRKMSQPPDRTGIKSLQAVARPTRRASAHRRSLPKLDRFPASTPLTEEERALLRLPPETAARLFANQHGTDLVSINIEPLRIDPL